MKNINVMAILKKLYF